MAEFSEIVRKWHREMALRFHPDCGGSNAAMIAISEGYQRLNELLGEAVIGNSATEINSVVDAGAFALVSPAAVKLWLVLSQAGTGSSTHGELGCRVGVTERTIPRLLRELQKIGWISFQATRGHGVVYRVSQPCMTLTESGELYYRNAIQRDREKRESQWSRRNEQIDRARGKRRGHDAA